MLVSGAVLQAAGHSFFGQARAEEGKEAGRGNIVVNRLSTADGKSLNMWVTVKAEGESEPLKASWQTPWEFEGAAGTTYMVRAHNWSKGGFFFSHWEDGSTGRDRLVALEAGKTVTLTAYYDVRTTGQDNSAAASTATAPPQQQPLPQQQAIQNTDSSGGSSPPTPSSSGSTRSTGVYVPLYKYPDLGDSDGMWNAVIKAKKAHPAVPFAVSVNPSNGPGWSADSRIKSAIGELRAAGVEHVLGYIPTMYATEPSGRTMADLKRMVDNYRAWYPEMDGLMMDTVAAGADKVWFYKELVSYAKSKGFSYVKANPGAKVDKAYFEVFDNISIYERYGAPSISTLASNTFNNRDGYGIGKFAFTAKGVAGLDTGYLEDARDYVGYMYMTDDGGGNPYNTVPPYFNSMVEALDS
ncbi:spherulation-specific family 4 protein [Nitrososphaera sp.]|uniref:spherulation-specific family 4 protein n=1 Tax=Nitrososphaera sp. TaxID=1971748 RepID=UPI00307E0037